MQTYECHSQLMNKWKNKSTVNILEHFVWIVTMRMTFCLNTQLYTFVINLYKYLPHSKHRCESTKIKEERTADNCD